MMQYKTFLQHGYGTRVLKVLKSRKDIDKVHTKMLFSLLGYKYRLSYYV